MSSVFYFFNGVFGFKIGCCMGAIREEKYLLFLNENIDDI